uniref:Uncharacterized protein n=1 Tax=Anguilla anguilla TaxID=7936 RepID=A0A0E9TA29_ANGAN
MQYKIIAHKSNFTQIMRFLTGHTHNHAFTNHRPDIPLNHTICSWT